MCEFKENFGKLDRKYNEFPLSSVSTKILIEFDRARQVLKSVKISMFSENDNELLN